MAGLFWRIRRLPANCLPIRFVDASDLPPPGVFASLPPASLFEALPDALARFDAAARIVYVNQAFEKALSVGRRSLFGRRFGEIEALAPYAALWQQQVQELLQTEEERWFKFSFDHPLGRRHFDVRLFLERDGLAPHVTALLRDVSYTRGVVRASRGADALAEAMLAAGNVGIALLDRGLRLRYFNEFLERLTGIEAGRACGRRLDEVFDLSGLTELTASLGRMGSGATGGSEQHEYALPAGDRPWVREQHTPIFDASGRFDGVFILIERLDPQRRAETSLSALRGALELAGELVLEVDADGTVVDANQTALRTLGLTREDCGRVLISQIDADLAPSEFAGLIERLRLNGAERREARYASRLRPGAALAVEVIAQRAGHGRRESILLLARDIGERKRTELALLESAERFRSLFDESPVALLLLDENLRVLQGNRAASRLLDRALIDLVGAEASTLLHAADAAAAARLRRDLLAETLHEEDADVRLLHADGRVVWTRMVARGWRAEGSRRLLLVLEDHTERKLTAMQLESAVAQQRTLLETMAAAVAQVRDGRVVHANGEFARLFGYPEQALAGIPLARLAEKAPDGQTAGPLPQIRAGSTASAETMLVTADGKAVWCLVQARAVPAAGGAEAIYTFQDVTAQREARDALARSLLELNLVFDSTEVALLHLAGGRIIRCNAQAVAMFGGDDDGPVGREFAALLEPIAEGPLPAWLDGGDLPDAAAAEVRMRGADGTTFWALVSLRAADAQRPAAGRIVTVLNIDARKRSEQEVRQMRNYLDLVVEALPVTIAVRDARDGRFVSINRAGEALLGRPREAVIGRTWHELYPPRLADELAALDAQALASGQTIEQPRALTQTVDGRRLTVHRRVLPVFDGGERPDAAAPRYLMSIVDDLSDTVRTEAALQDTEARFRELAEHIDAFVFIADSTLARLIYASPRCEALLGIPAARLQADPRLALECVQAQERPALARRLPLVLARLARLRRTEMTVRIDHPGSGPRSISVRFTPVRTPDGGLRVFGLAEDATEREAVQDRRLASALKSHELLVLDVRQRLRKNLRGVAGLLQQQAYARPELAEPLIDAASQIQAIALVHGIHPTDGGLPLTALVQGVFSELSATHNAIVQVEPPGSALAGWRVADREAVPMALVINELGSNAIKHRSKGDLRVVARLAARGDRVELRIEQPGRLTEDFDLARVGAGVSGLALAKSLLPHRGARLRLDQLGPLVITRLELSPPAIRFTALPEAEGQAGARTSHGDGPS
jgi:PAS domain S-box-containing protein